jgi:hypothetical protein
MGSENGAKRLASDPIGVSRETKPRTISVNGESFMTTIDPTFLRQLGLDKGSQVYHSLHVAPHPVVVELPALIVQPVEVIQSAEKSNGKNTTGVK